MTISGLWVL